MYIGMKEVKKSYRSRAYISIRDSLIYLMIKYGQHYYHLPQFSDTSKFSLDIIAFAFSKDFEYMDEFNKLYVY